MERFWGDNYFDAEAKKWTSDSESSTGKPLKRAFVSFIMDPIIKLATSIMEGNTEQMNKMIEALQLKLTQEDRVLTGKHFLKAVMSKWLNAADTLLEMMVLHLPSPATA